MAQKHTPTLARELIPHFKHTLIETNGTYPLADLPPEIHKIIDLKPPSSKIPFEPEILQQNLPYITPRDEFKILIADETDYNWAKSQIQTYALTDLTLVNLSPVHPLLPQATLIEWILRDALPVRFNMQIHKSVWEPDKRGV